MRLPSPSWCRRSTLPLSRPLRPSRAAAPQANAPVGPLILGTRPSRRRPNSFRLPGDPSPALWHGGCAGRGAVARGVVRPVILRATRWSGRPRSGVERSNDPGPASVGIGHQWCPPTSRPSGSRTVRSPWSPGAEALTRPVASRHRRSPRPPAPRCARGDCRWRRRCRVAGEHGAEALHGLGDDVARCVVAAGLQHAVAEGHAGGAALEVADVGGGDVAVGASSRRLPSGAGVVEAVVHRGAVGIVSVRHPASCHR
jgi:hypothetical protein